MKPKVLIIDDDATVRQQLFWLLCDDYEVLTASDLATAVRRATIYEPDLSILDLHLPPATGSPHIGLRALEYVKGRLPQSKVFVISSDQDVETREACARAGADAFLPKPIDVELMLSELRRATLSCRLTAA